MKTHHLYYRDGVLKNLVKEEMWNSLTEQRFADEERKFKHHFRYNYKVSIVTTCKDRCCDLKKTYIKNIEDCMDYLSTEFVLINYNSQDDLNEWVKKELMVYIRNGYLNYYQVMSEYKDQYKYFNLSHSKNIGFKVAQGDIVNNVDADHYVNPGFSGRISIIANQMKNRKYMFVKSRQKNRGRIGFFKDEFINTVGGYNEDLTDYGFEDPDLILRATKLGFISWRFGGEFFREMEGHERHLTSNYENKDWKYTQRRNTLVSLLGLQSKLYKTNQMRPWGNAKLLKNFKDRVEV